MGTYATYGAQADAEIATLTSANSQQHKPR